MVRCLVTGAAGFIGSHLCEQLLVAGHDVKGSDAYIPYYPREIKENSIARLTAFPNFTFHELDLRHAELEQLLEGVAVVFHLAAMPGLVGSWSNFDLYMSCNLQATYRLLEAVRHANISHFMYGSTSSVYGRIATGNEEMPLLPVSPYGVTKLSAELLCQAYARNFDLPLTILRFFSVYGPGQRPDMAYHRFIQAVLQNLPVTIYGDGNQSRSNTYIADCVRGILLAFERRERSLGEIFNIGGGEVVTINQVVDMLSRLAGKPLQVSFAQVQAGDQLSTAADFSKAERLLNYKPAMSVMAGLQEQLKWQRALQHQQEGVLLS
jgi:nucleoside-diphosphate-sugar epimerase